MAWRRHLPIARLCAWPRAARPLTARWVRHGQEAQPPLELQVSCNEGYTRHRLKFTQLQAKQHLDFSNAERLSPSDSAQSALTP